MNRSTTNLECILAEAIEIVSAADRQAFVDKACAGDAELHARVERLMANHFRAGVFLERPAAILEMAALSGGNEPPGTQIGPYKLLEQIGEGGMGLVYVAEQQQPIRRTVALKIIKPGMDSKQVIARFEAERQALALMDHPNIAKVLDAGTIGEAAPRTSVCDPPQALADVRGSGRPYFVMELVRGIPITDYCDQACLTIRQRLEVFLQVCRAIQHAHTKGVIHRDLKPGNVLVTSYDGVPMPMVIDFGVAKALGQQLTEQTLHTGFAQMIGTPLYMSPEQAEFNQLGVDTRSDIYSLGVLLYELLTGVTPFDRERLRTVDHEELRRILREEEPPRLSARLSTLGAVLSTASERRGVDARKLTQTLHGELDWIALKSLEKDRTRRYETASAFAADIERYLKDEPVEACPPSAAYRFRKFAGRNRRILTTAGVIAIALVMATAVSAWQALSARNAQRLAEAAERRATTEAASARALNDFLQGDLFGQVGSDPWNREELSGNANLTVKEALDRAAAKIGTRFQDQPLLEATIRMAIGKAYGSLNQNTLALPHLERALALRRANLDPAHPDILESMDNLAGSYAWVARFHEAIALRQETLENRRATLGADHPATLICMSSLAHAYQMSRQFDASIPLHQLLLEKQLAICGPTDPSTLATMHYLAMNYRHVGRLAESLALHEKHLDAVKLRYGPEHESTIWPRLTFAQTCQQAGDLDHADQLLREALAAIQKQESSRHWREARARTLGWMALSLCLRKRFVEAEPLAREAVTVTERESSHDQDRFYLVSVLGEILLGQERFAEAEPLILNGYESLRKAEATHYIGIDRITEAGARVVRFYEATNQPEQARAWREKLLAK